MTHPVKPRPNIQKPESFSGPFTKAVDEIEKGINAVISEVQRICAHVSSNSVALAPVAYWVSQALGQLSDTLKKIVPLVKKLLKHSMPVVALFETASDWYVQVSGPLTDTQNEIDHYQPNLSHWSDNAFTAYDRVRATQSNATTAIVDDAKAVAAFLETQAVDNLSFMLETAKIVTKLLGAMTDAAVDTAGIVSIPEALDKLAGSCGSIVEEGMNNLIDMVKKFAGDYAKTMDLFDQGNTRTYLPDGHWPKVAP